MRLGFRRVQRSAAAVVLLAVAGLVATTATASAKSTARAAAKGSIPVALVSDFTGALAPSTGVQGALAYFHWLNAHGGVDGHKITVKQYDAGSSPTTALQAFRRAIAAKPAAILESASGEEISSLSAVTSSGIPVVDDGFAPGWIDKPTLFSPVGDVSTHLSDVWLTVLKHFGHATKVAVIGSSLETGDLKLLAKSGPDVGVKVVMTDLSEPETLTSAQALTLAEQIKSSGANGVSVIGVLAINQLQADLNQLGVKVTVADPVFESDAQFGKTIDGELFAEDWASPYVKNNAGIKAYLAAMKSAGYGSVAYSAGFAPFRYAQAEMLVQEGLKKAGAPFSHKAVIKALSGVKNWTANGILAPVSFPQFQQVGIHCLSVMKVVNGKWVPETNGNHPFVCGGPSTKTPGT